MKRTTPTQTHLVALPSLSLLISWLTSVKLLAIWVELSHLENIFKQNA